MSTLFGATAQKPRPESSRKGILSTNITASLIFARQVTTVLKIEKLQNIHKYSKLVECFRSTFGEFKILVYMAQVYTRLQTWDSDF